MRWYHRGVSLRIERSFGFALLVVVASLGPGTLPGFALLVAGVTAVVAVRELAQAAVLANARPRIILSALGGETVPLKPVPAGRLILARLAGPAALLALSMVAPQPLAKLAQAWGLVSLAPVYPLPGGRILARGIGKAVYAVSAMMACALALGTLAYAPVALLFAVGFAANAARMVGRPLAFDPVRDDLRDGVEELRRGQPTLALHTLRDAFAAAPSDLSAACYARVLIELGRLDEATRLLEDPAAGPQLFSRLMEALFYAGRYPEAARVGERSWAVEEEARTAFNLACTYARLEQPEAALGWLSRALDVGWRDLAGLDEDPDLAPLRARPEWAPLRARLTSLGPRA